MKDGALDVKTHKWLAQVDWKKAEARKLEAPWKPKIKSATDASNFDEFPPNTGLGKKYNKYLDSKYDETWEKEFGADAA